METLLFRSSIASEWVYFYSRCLVRLEKDQIQFGIMLIFGNMIELITPIRKLQKVERMARIA